MDAFKPRQRVQSLCFAGPTLTPDWSERVTIVRKADSALPGYWVVRFDDESKLCVHENRLRPLERRAT